MPGESGSELNRPTDSSLSGLDQPAIDRIGGLHPAFANRKRPQELLNSLAYNPIMSPKF
jgi:hypothetical protein